MVDKIMKPIGIISISHKEQRYNTVGDYFENEMGLQFRISNLKNEFYEYLILIHELTEYILIKKKGIPIKLVDEFDMNFKGKGQAGDDPTAPYHDAHIFATLIERLLCSQLEFDWKKYDDYILGIK